MTIVAGGWTLAAWRDSLRTAIEADPSLRFGMTVVAWTRFFGSWRDSLCTAIEAGLCCARDDGRYNTSGLRSDYGWDGLAVGWGGGVAGEDC